MKKVLSNGFGDIARSKSDPMLPNSRPPCVVRLVETDQDVSSSSTSSTELDMNQRYRIIATLFIVCVALRMH